MFNFFCNLAISIYAGEWVSNSNSVYITGFIKYMKSIPLFGLFNNSTEAFYNTSTNYEVTSQWITRAPDLAYTIAVILSTICCISVFFIIVKAVKKLFTCFLDF